MRGTGKLFLNRHLVSCTFSWESTGRYYVSLTYIDAESPIMPFSGKQTGIDMGVRRIVTLDNGDFVENQRYWGAEKQRIRRLQKCLSRKVKDSNNYVKTRMRLARAHRCIANRRKNFIHQLSYYLVVNYDLIVIEDLHIKSMMRHRSLTIALTDASLYELRKQLVYKCAWYGKQLITVPRNFPSSQICSFCGTKAAFVKDTHIREWKCPICGAQHDRDQNAAINLLHYALA